MSLVDAAKKLSFQNAQEMLTQLIHEHSPTIGELLKLKEIHPWSEFNFNEFRITGWSFETAAPIPVSNKLLTRSGMLNPEGKQLASQFIIGALYQQEKPVHVSILREEWENSNIATILPVDKITGPLKSLQAQGLVLKEKTSGGPYGTLYYLSSKGKARAESLEQSNDTSNAA